MNHYRMPTEDIGFVLEGRWRDDLWRFGGMVTLDL